MTDIEFIKIKKADLGKKAFTKDISGKGVTRWITESITMLPQNNTSNSKILVIERLKLLDRKGEFLDLDSPIGSIEYRIGYFIKAKKEGLRKGMWVWGQYSPFIPLEDFNKLFDLAIKEGTILTPFV